MEVLKFGGTSLADAQRILQVAELISKRQEDSRLGIVVSAMAGVTNFLAKAIDSALAGEAIEPRCSEFLSTHIAAVETLASELGNLEPKPLINLCHNVAQKLEQYLQGVQLLGECSARIYASIIILGERISVEILEHVLAAQNISVKRIASEDNIITCDSYTNAKPLYEETYSRFARHIDSPERVLLMAGFIAGGLDGRITTLGRNGSDYSAALMAVGLKANVLEIWTDVDGIYSTDPNVVSDAILLDAMSYEEAMELSFFGAKVLHPKTIAPIAAHQIPTRIKNTLNPGAPGTFIHQDTPQSNALVKGISLLDNVAMLSISGSGMKGIPGIATRIFSAISRKEISLILITQSSSEYTIGFCVAREDAERAHQALTNELQLELDAQLIKSIECRVDLSVISVVGDGMRTKRGVAGKFFSALASIDVNVVAISQGAAERSISAVVENKDAVPAVLISHQFFFNTCQDIHVFIFGVGTVGSRLLEQIQGQQHELLSQKINIKVCAIANSKKAVLNENGIELSDWQQALAEAEDVSSIEALIQFQKDQRLLNAIFVDCTSSEQVSLSYNKIFAAGMHIATPNKKANTDSDKYYHDIRLTANERGRKFLYETNVGAGLPVIDTLQNLIKSGDKLLAFEGILSGSLSYVFGLLDDGLSFSQAVKNAMENGFTEPDPRDDLSGMDVARKLLILFRESGYHAEINDVKIEPILPASFGDPHWDVTTFVQKLSEVDEHFSQLQANAQKEGKTLRCVGEIKDGICQVSTKAVDSSNPLFHIRDGENALAFTTVRYNPVPLVIRGYGAGADVTAAGVFADILRTVSWNPTSATARAQHEH